MICIRVVLTKTYVDHGLFNVPQKTRVTLEMVNLVVMFATFFLNISLCITELWRWENVDLLPLILGTNIVHALVLLLIMAMAIYHWTLGGLSLLPLKHLYLHFHFQGLVLSSGRRRPCCLRIL